MDNRYGRHLLLDDFDEITLERIQSATVGIVGAGALGSVVAMFLAGAGVGSLRIVEFDTVALSNLHRQVFFKESEIGEHKGRVICERVKSLNSNVKTELFPHALTKELSGQFFDGCDVVAECSDRAMVKRMVIREGKGCCVPVVVGGVSGYRGQISVFTPDTSVFYDDIFPEKGNPDVTVDGKAVVRGVFSPVPGIVASVQTAEILKIIGGIGSPLANALLDFDVRDMNFRKYNFG